MKKTAIITGASSGLGRDFAKEILKANIDEIWLIARREERLKELAEQLNTKTKIFSLDLSDLNNHKIIEDELKKGEYEIKYLINNAGFGLYGEFENISLEKQLNMINLNVTALVNLTYICLNYMKENSQIIQVASTAGFLPIKNFAVYAATKAFVLNFSNAISLELKSRKIKVTAVCPGPVKTEFFEVASNGKEPLLIYKSEDVVKKALKDSNKGKLISIYGFIMNLLIISSNFIPRKIKAVITAKAL